MSARRGRALFALSLALQACIVAGLALAARSGCSPSTVAAALAFCFIPYAGAVVSSRSLPSKRVVDRIAIGTALFFGAALVFAPPLLSDDVYRYLWEGRLWLEGINPYRLAPDDPALAQFRDELWVNINNKPLGSIYPPLAQLLFVAAQWLGGKVWSVKLVALLAHVLSVAAVARVCTERRASLALAMNPLLLSEAALNGHFDISCGVALLIAAWALSRHRFVQAGVAACAAVGLKVVGLVLLPLMARRPKMLVATGLTSALLLMPLVWSRALGDPGSGLGQFATRWRGNDSVFALIHALSGTLFGESLADLAARLSVAAALLLLCFLIVHRRLHPLQATRALVWAVLLLSPQVHPWYLAWLLPLEVAAGGSAGLVWSAAVLVAYAPLDQWVTEQVWELSPSLQILEYAAVAVALMLDPRRPSLRRPASEELFPT
ncbi:MAG: DUF2029 domain-containing protein [Deltaproteobacteria bacterium]|nr:DUF2029 domain-containing protein [Deltaproteobacteria bacterium]MBW1875035.1 DUF2029 domain-containing protein [Deltaproteobacteria bacterium]MBW2210729.1 DUF2029 domain-containing protein [Deltaproteobacteria bacterium]MBW2213116.1 DUF2029 domain-containing protein [Deltaproteobacteria bacterium]MBW2549425.1 DUF2029 domain-containing protein [Deltaproteobacteria bacterium]